MENLGNTLYRIVNQAKADVFAQGELTQLTYMAFDFAATQINQSEDEEFRVNVPIGYQPDRTTLDSTYTYSKNQLLEKYNYLALEQLAINGVFQLVTIIEAMLGDVVRVTILKFPKKLGGKTNISLQLVLESSSIEEIHTRATDTLLNSLTYKSPTEFAEEIEKYVSVNLIECAAFHKYLEIKATRDIFIHNRGIANDTYLKKAGTHARVKNGMKIPMDVQYFLESYEQCLQMIEWLENELHEHWHSTELENEKKRQLEMNLKSNDNQGNA